MAGDYLKRYHDEDWYTPRGRIIRDVVYAIDIGLVATVAFLAGITLTAPNSQVVLFAGLVDLVAGAVALFFGAYISTKAQVDFFENQVETERRHLVEKPDWERREVREILEEMGFDDAEQEMAMARITADPDRWLRFMAREELGINPNTFDNPALIGMVAAVSYIAGALPPLAPFIVIAEPSIALQWAGAEVLVFLFLVGAVKTRITKVHWLKSALETLALGAISSSVGFGLGRLAIALFAH